MSHPPNLIKLVHSVVKELLGKRDDRDDLVQEAYLGLQEGLKNVAEGKCPHVNIHPYLRVVIKRHVIDYISKGHIITVPRRSYAAGLRSPIQDHGTPPDTAYQPDLTALDVKMISESVCYTEQDRTILRMLMEGYTGEEICKRLEITKQVFAQEKHKLKRRIKEKMI